MTAEEVVKKLGLEPLEHEGGFFSRVFTSAQSVEAVGAERPAGTVIFFLVTPNDFSALHLLGLTEFYTHLAGDLLELTILDPAQSTEKTLKLGPITNPDAVLSFCVPPGVWQGSRLGESREHGWALVSCTLAPGFHWSDFELGERAKLQAAFPDSAEIIEHLTRS
ncbi:MAG: cupin domain-containing protein [Opitutales bacterium]